MKCLQFEMWCRPRDCLVRRVCTMIALGWGTPHTRKGPLYNKKNLCVLPFPLWDSRWERTKTLSPMLNVMFRNFFFWRRFLASAAFLMLVNAKSMISLCLRHRDGGNGTVCRILSGGSLFFRTRNCLIQSKWCKSLGPLRKTLNFFIDRKCL